MVYFGYARAHCALYGGFDKDLADLKGFEVKKGTIKFTPEKPLPDRLITKIVKARMAAIDKGD